MHSCALSSLARKRVNYAEWNNAKSGDVLAFCKKRLSNSA